MGGLLLRNMHATPTYLSLLAIALVGDAAQTAGNAAGSYRKDVYLPGYKEAVDYPVPTQGGRVHCVITGSTCGAPTSVKVNGQEAMGLPDDSPDFTYFDWSRVHHDNATGVVWVSFHSRNVEWLDKPKAPKLSLEIQDSTGTCFSGDVVVDQAFEPTLSYVTTRKAGTEMVVHIQSAASTNISSIAINGARVPAGNVLLEPDQTTVLTVPMTKPLVPGQIWSVEISVGGSVGGWGGRVLPEEFVVQAWPHGGDCPIPGVNQTNANDVSKLGVNAIFDGDSGCGDVADLADKLAAQDLPTMLSLKLKHLGDVKNTSKIASVFIGDEVDGKMDENLRDTTPSQANQMFPQLPTYQGAKTNAHVGSYSGITDIQGMDAYAGACAPTIVPVIHKIPIDYPYLYLRNARNNHMPLPTWLYSQLYSEAWSYQCNENEIVVQIGMTVLAGAKGLTLFQTHASLMAQHALGPIRQSLNGIRGIGDIIREGDIDGGTVSASNQDDYMVGVIRAPNQVVVVLLNTNAHGYSGLTCHALVGKHWTFHDASVDSLTVTIPTHLKALNPMEQVGSDRNQAPSGVSASGNEIKFKNINLDSKTVVRYFVFDVSHA